MKYVIEVDADSEKGSKLLKYMWELNAPESDIPILSEPPLKDEEMAMPPTRRVTQATLDAWLEPKEDEEGVTGEESLAYIRKLREEDKKKRKNDF